MSSFKDIGKYMEEIVCGEHGVPGCDILVKRSHETLYRYTCGYSDRENKIPLSPEQLYFIYSNTKPVTATAGMRLVEEGILKLDDPLMKYMPEFADAYIMKDGERTKISRPILIKHLFTMTAGYDYGLRSPVINELLKNSGGNAGTVEINAAHASRPMAAEPGERFIYSVCHDILAAVIEIAAGMRFSEYLKKIMFEPLGMENSTFSGTPDVLARVSEQYASDKDGNITRVEKVISHVLTPNYESGGAGLISSVEDYSKFADTMSCGGRSAEGYRLLKPETIKLMTAEQLSKVANDTGFSCAAGPGYGYGLGVRTRVTHEGGRSPLGEFGWDGAAGAYVMMETTNAISITFGMHVLNWPSCIGSDHRVMRDIVYDTLGL
ncbi:MAG: beta-lactamase family protein [Clostridiales bacterium]|nr:beta-lactamase family protein [Clostridiales bacterium]